MNWTWSVFWEQALTLKGVTDLAQRTVDKIRQLVALREQRNLSFAIEADGAIRRHTVPQLRQAGADIVVPGSLIFQNDVDEVSQWLHSL